MDRGAEDVLLAAEFRGDEVQRSCEKAVLLGHGPAEHVCPAGCDKNVKRGRAAFCQPARTALAA